MTVATRRRLPATLPPRPPVRAPWPMPLDPDDVTVSLVWLWLADAGELGKPMARRPGGARLGERDCQGAKIGERV